jgi:hypothetical protein
MDVIDDDVDDAQDSAPVVSRKRVLQQIVFSVRRNQEIISQFARLPCS